MPRLFYAVPYALPFIFSTHPSWDFKLYSTTSAEEVATALELWNQQVEQYPKPLSRPKTKQVELFTTSLCQTIGDLWRWRMGDRVGRYHTWTENESPPRTLELHHTFTSSSWRYTFFNDIHLCIPSTKLLHLGRQTTPPNLPAPLGHLMNGIVEVVDYFVMEDQTRLAKLERSKALDENPGSAPAVVTPLGVIKHIALPLSVSIAGRPTGTELYFFQRQGFTRLPGGMREGE